LLITQMPLWTLFWWLGELQYGQKRAGCKGDQHQPSNPDLQLLLRICQLPDRFISFARAAS